MIAGRTCPLRPMRGHVIETFVRDGGSSRPAFFADAPFVFTLGYTPGDPASLFWRPMPSDIPSPRSALGASFVPVVSPQSPTLARHDSAAGCGHAFSHSVCLIMLALLQQRINRQPRVQRFSILPTAKSQLKLHAVNTGMPPPTRL